MKLEILDDKSSESYNLFIESNNFTTFEYTLKWKNILEKNFSFKPFFIVSKDENNLITGVLPLFKAKSIFGTRFVSTPYSIYTPIIAENSQIKDKIAAFAVELTTKENQDYLEIREKQEGLSNPNFVQKKSVFNFSLSLDDGPENILKRLPKGSVRWGIKKAQCGGLKFTKGNSSKDLNNFYDLFLKTRKFRGVPGYPFVFFRDIIQKFGDDCRIYTVYKENKPIAAIFLLYHKKEVRYAFAGALHDKEIMQLQPYHLIIWEAIKDACKDGYSIFNFGGASLDTNDGGLYDFKKKWSDKIMTVPYYFYFNKDNKDKDPNSFLFKMASGCWKRLPLWVIKRLDYYVIRQFV